MERLALFDGCIVRVRAAGMLMQVKQGSVACDSRPLLTRWARGVRALVRAPPRDLIRIKTAPDCAA